MVNVILSGISNILSNIWSFILNNILIYLLLIGYLALFLLFQYIIIRFYLFIGRSIKHLVIVTIPIINIIITSDHPFKEIYNHFFKLNK